MTTASFSTYASLEAAKEAKRRELRDACDDEVRAVRGRYPAVERDTWPSQQQEAAAYKAWVDGGSQGTAPDTPVLDGIASDRTTSSGQTVTTADMANKVNTKVAEFRGLAQAAVGKRQGLDDLVEAATTIREVAEVQW